MIKKIICGMSKLDNLAYSFAMKHQIILDDILFDDGVIDLRRDPHLIELRCGGKKKIVHVSIDEIINCTIDAQRRLEMALMHFVPITSDLEITVE